MTGSFNRSQISITSRGFIVLYTLKPVGVVNLPVVFQLYSTFSFCRACI